jgi:hypothetical protein
MDFVVVFVVNGVVIINSCNPQMLQCVLCRFFNVQIDVRNLSQGKNKKLLSYNKDHGTSSLEKPTSNGV